MVTVTINNSSHCNLELPRVLTSKSLVVSCSLVKWPTFQSFSKHCCFGNLMSIDFPAVVEQLCLPCCNRGTWRRGKMEVRLTLSVNFIFLLYFSTLLVVGTNMQTLWVVTSLPFCTSGWVYQSGVRATLYSFMEQVLCGTSQCIFSNIFQGYKVCLNLQVHKRHCTMQVRTLFILIIDFLMTLSNVLSELLGIQTVFFTRQPIFWPFQFSRDHVNDGTTALVILV